MAEKLTQVGGNGLDPIQLQGFLNRYAALPACLASTVDLRRAYANAPGSKKITFGS